MSLSSTANEHKHHLQKQKFWELSPIFSSSMQVMWACVSYSLTSNRWNILELFLTF